MLASGHECLRIGRQVIVMYISVAIGWAFAAESEQHTSRMFGRRLAMTSAQKSVILKKHNDLRAAVTVPCTAANMARMTWDESLAIVSEAHAARCEYKHDPNNNVFAWGENLAMSTNKFFDESKLVAFVQGWYDQIVDTDWSVDGTSASSKIYADPLSQCRSYDTNTGKCMIGQYTQLVAAQTNKVGCGAFACDSGLLGAGGTLFVCKYTPAGNHLALGRASGLQPPYTVGASCAACPQNCSNRLCGSVASCGNATCQLPIGLGGDFCGQNRGVSNSTTVAPMSTMTSSTSFGQTTVTTTVTVSSASTVCDGLQAVPVGPHTGTDCSSGMIDGSFCSAYCSPGHERLGAFLCSRGKLVDASYCMASNVVIRTSFRLKVATSLSLYLDANPSIEALRRSLAGALGVWEYLVHKVSWLPSATRRLGESRRINANSFSVDFEIIVPKNTTASATVARTALLYVNGSRPRNVFTDTMRREFGLKVNKIEQVVRPRSFQSLVLSDHVGNIIRIPGLNGTQKVPNSIVQADGVSVGVLIVAIAGAGLGVLIFIFGTYFICRRSKFDA